MKCPSCGMEWTPGNTVYECGAWLTKPSAASAGYAIQPTEAAMKCKDWSRCLTRDDQCENKQCYEKASAGVLPERERWLMRQAFIAGWDRGEAGSQEGMDEWLSDMAADAVTVQMVLAHEAPPDELATLRARLTDEERKNTNLRHGLEEMEREKNAAHRKGYSEGLAYIRARLTEVEGKLETERIRLAGCGVAAMCNTRESMEAQRITPDNPYYSASYEDVLKAVEREMKYRDQLTQARAALAEMTERAKVLGEAVLEAHRPMRYVKDKKLGWIDAPICPCDRCTIAREVVKP